MPVREHFENELKSLKKELIKMGALIEESLENTMKSFKTNDAALAKQIIANDRKVNDAEKNIEAKCLSLILCEQPVAKDLRVVSMSLKMVTDMERIGDHASDICEIMLRMENPELNTVKHIPLMAEKAIEMVKNSINAFVNSDYELAQTTIKADDEVDDLFNKVKNDVVTILKQSADNSDIGVDFLMISKYLERIADHAVNICEWVEFNQTGEYKNFRII